MRISILLVGLLLGGCGTPCCRREATAEIRSAPESAVINGRTYRLTADLWRDFQPVAPPDGQPLRAVVRVNPDDNMPLPDDVAIDRVWVVNGKEQWSPGLTDQSEKLVANLTDGPKWGPGVNVDVVVRLARGKETWLLRAEGLPITRTD